MSDGRPVRLISFLYRKPGMSVEDFAKHWRENHSRVFTSAKYVQEKVVNYEQVRSALNMGFAVPNRGETLISRLSPMSQIHPNRLLHQGLHSSNISAEECDGIVILDFDSFDDARGLLEDKASLFGVSRTSVIGDLRSQIDRVTESLFFRHSGIQRSRGRRRGEIHRPLEGQVLPVQHRRWI